MVDLRKISPKSYYDYLPKLAHSCGDIWRDLPSFNVLGTHPLTGIIVSAACDLTQRKTETATFLPVIPATAYFSTVGALPVLRSRVGGLLNAARCTISSPWSGEGFSAPSKDAVKSALSEVAAYVNAKQRGQKELVALAGASAGLRVLELVAKGEVAEPCSEDLTLLFGREWGQTKSDIVRNAYSADLHFLPADGQAAEVAGVSRHSVVLIRYPMTLPISILDLASGTDNRLWPAVASAESQRTPALRLSDKARPMKMLSLRTEFLSDLLSRYLAIYGRYGSPDFSAATIQNFSDEMDLQ